MTLFFYRVENMKLKIYNNNSNNNVLNKKITPVSELDFNLKTDNSIMQPILVLKNYVKGNYCYIDELKRYYFINDVRLLTGGLYELHLDVDVLMTYKNEIINAEWYSVNGVNVTIPNEIDYNSLVDYEQFLLTIGG